VWNQAVALAHGPGSSRHEPTTPGRDSNAVISAPPSRGRSLPRRVPTTLAVDHEPKRRSTPTHGARGIGTTSRSESATGGELTHRRCRNEATSDSAARSGVTSATDEGSSRGRGVRGAWMAAAAGASIGTPHVPDNSTLGSACRVRTGRAGASAREEQRKADGETRYRSRPPTRVESCLARPTSWHEAHSARVSMRSARPVN